ITDANERLAVERNRRRCHCGGGRTGVQLREMLFAVDKSDFTGRRFPKWTGGRDDQVAVSLDPALDQFRQLLDGNLHGKCPFFPAKSRHVLSSAAWHDSQCGGNEQAEFRSLSS